MRKHRRNSRDLLVYGLQNATVPSEGTHPVGEGACRRYNKLLHFIAHHGVCMFAFLDV